jgi:heme exporter protein C
MQKHWWKILSFSLLLVSIYFGLTIKIPYFPILEHTLRNVFFHVPMWFGMIILYTISFVFSILYLNKLNPAYDYRASAFGKAGTLFGLLGLVTGMLWARAAWGSYWNNDPKQIGAAICILIYLAYFVLRQSVKDPDKKGRIASVYNIFAYFLMFPAIYIIPGLLVGQHPGGASPDDEPLMVFKMAPSLRLIFYPAVIGWCLLGVWIAQLRYRIDQLNEQNDV